MPSAELFELDADLLTYVPEQERRAAARASQLTVERVRRGAGTRPRSVRRAGDS
jgi:hypothetical protein